MNDRMYAIDLDGTLLRNDKTISEDTVSFIRELKNKNAIVILITGRNFSSTKKYIDILGLTNLVSCNDGKKVYSFDGKLISEHQNLNFDDVEIIKEKIPPLSYMICYKDEQEYIVGKKHCLCDFSLIVYLLKKIIKKCRCTYLCISDKNAENVLQNIDKIVLWTPRIRWQYATLKNFFRGTYQVFWIEDERKIQFMSNNVNKINSLRDIQKFYKVSDENVYVFGNDGNDEQMIKGYNNNYVVRNASNEIKALTSHVIESNEDNGVLKALMLIQDGYY